VDTVRGLTFRPMCHDDLDLFAEFLGDPECVRYLIVPRPHTRAESGALLDRWVAQHEGGGGGRGEMGNGATDHGTIDCGSPSGGMGGEHEVEELVEARQAGTQIVPVIDAGLDEARQLFELLAADSGLRVERF